jgi:phosphoribosylaminoimidazole carboxylase/phosphoribosylaminoimidazole-succinocarboxamide synthase
MSGHKTTVESLKRAEKIFSTFPQGGVFVCEVGRSNGLGPILASHVPWPVISCPATLKEFPNDIWSSLRMPSDVPLLAAWPEANAVNAALGILAQTNPEVYAHLQLKRESMDNYIV